MFEIFDRKFSAADIILLAILCGILSLVFGCSSAPKVYPCPIGHSVPMEKINKDIQAKNTCPTCGKDFPYLKKEKKKSVVGVGSRVRVYRSGTTRFHSYRHH